jgi:NADPH:quinone reductase-like Zn-dependent oxidoreductase
MMKAVVLTEPGGVENLQLQEVKKAQPRSGEVLVQVHALSINPVDIKTRKGGALYASLKEQPPVILGWDISGVVVEVGSDVHQFKEGDAVFGMVNFPGHGRAYAEYVAAPATHLALKPSAITHAQAAATTLAALTAWQVLFEQAGLSKGQHVLVHAAAGGVGHFAVQLARHAGAQVSGTASDANARFLQEIGAHRHIDYTKQKFYEELKDVDVVLDPIGGETTEHSLQVLRPGGVLVSIVGGVKDHLKPVIEKRKVQAKNYLVHSSGADMERLGALLGEGVLKPYISHHFPFEDIARAHGQIETGKTRGKVVVVLIAG